MRATTWRSYRRVWRGTGTAGRQWMHYLTSSKAGCPCPSPCLNVLCGSPGVKMNLRAEEVALVVLPPPPPPFLGCSPAGRHGTEPEMSRATHSTLPRWPRSALCGQRCGGSGARRSRWLPALETAVRPCRGRSGSTKAKPHGSTPTQTDRQTDNHLFLTTWGHRKQAANTNWHMNCRHDAPDLLHHFQVQYLANVNILLVDQMCASTSGCRMKLWADVVWNLSWGL